MKTQLFTLAITFVLSFNTLFAENNNASTTPDQVPVTDLTWVDETNEESLTIQEWMTSDKDWDKTYQLPALDTTVETEEELTIEPWMTNTELWKVKQTVQFSNSTITINGVTYKIYNHNNDVESPLNIEAWMTNDKLWSL